MKYISLFLLLFCQLIFAQDFSIEKKGGVSGGYINLITPSSGLIMITADGDTMITADDDIMSVKEEQAYLIFDNYIQGEKNETFIVFNSVGSVVLFERKRTMGFSV